MKKISVLLATFIIVATSLTSCKKTVSSNEFGKKDTTAVIVDSILQKR